MIDFWTAIAAEARDLAPLEVVAVVAAIAYLLLAIRQNIWCWLGAAISTAIYVYLFFVAKLYMESALNLFYFAMAAYGWSVWYFGRSDGEELPVSVWGRNVHGIAIALIVAASLVSGYLLARYSDAAYPYIDSMTTWGAIWATFLVARKVLENWWYWLLFVAYVLMIPFGLIAWRRSWREQSA